MKKLIIALIICLIPVFASAGLMQQLQAVIAKKNSGGTPSYTNYINHANASFAYLYSDNLNDSTSNANNLTASGTPTYSSSGLPNSLTSGKSVLFAADTGTLADPSDDVLGEVAFGDFTLCSWYQSTDAPTSDTYIDFSGVAQIRSYSGAYYLFEMRLYNSSWVSKTTTNGRFEMSVDTWYHVCYQFNDTTNNMVTYASSNGGSFGDIINGATDALDTDKTASNTGESLVFGGFPIKLYQTIFLDTLLNTTQMTELYAHGIDGND